MNKNKTLILFIILSISIGIVIYVGSDNLYLGLGSLVMFLFASVLVFVPRINKSKKAIARFHECYHFINNFIISLSIKKAIKPSLENTVLSMDQDFKNMIDGLSNMDEEAIIRYLRGTYFPFHVYSLFIEIIDIYLEQGGDILKMSKYLLQECRLTEEYLNIISSYSTKKYLDFSILWAISLSILILLRFTLTQFYGYIKSQIFFIAGLAALVAFIIFSIYLLVMRTTKIEIKGYDEHEKIV